MSATPPVQLRLSFATPTRPVELQLLLAGVYVIVETAPGHGDEAFAYLLAAGAAPTVSEQGDLRFDVRHLTALAELPAQVRLRTDPSLAALTGLALHPSADALPATLSCAPSGELVLNWFDGEDAQAEVLYPEAAAALLQAELPFEATPQAWAVLNEVCHLPLIAGRVRVNLDGYLEISTTKPQMVETSPIPGLFRIDETHFGVALPYRDALERAPAFSWDAPPHTLERGPDVLPVLPLQLGSTDERELRDLVDALAAYHARAVVWEAGLGRRLFALAALECLDAWPVTIVTLPSGVWTWQRHLDLFGRSHALTHDRADAHILTYTDLVHRRVLPQPQAIVFDDLTSAEASSPEVRAALRRFDTLADVYRIATAPTWPTTPAESVELMSVLRPGEFPRAASIVQRYPLAPERRAHEHVGAYLSLRSHEDDRPALQRSSVRVVAPSEMIMRALEELPAKLTSVSPAQVLAEALEIVSAGPPQALSPKLPLVSTLARAGVEAGRRVAVCTRHRRSATLLRATLRPLRVALLDAGEGSGSPAPDAQVVIVRFERTLPDLRGFDEVIVMDYPWSGEVIERAVGSAADDHACPQVSTIHMPGTVDDRLAMLAARRRELGAVSDPAALPSPEDVLYLLAPRR